MLLAATFVTFLCGVQLPNHKPGELTCVAEDKIFAPGLRVVLTEHDHNPPKPSKAGPEKSP